MIFWLKFFYFAIWGLRVLWFKVVFGDLGGGLGFRMYSRVVVGMSGLRYFVRFYTGL